MLARTVGDRILGDGPDLAFAGVARTLATADLVSANLECTLSDRGTPAAKGFTFRGPPAAADALVAAGVSVVSLANNHTLDYGPEALADTEGYLDLHHIAHAGAGANVAAARSPAVLERNGLRVAFLSYADVPLEWLGFDTRSWEAGPESAGIAWLDPAEVQADVSNARRMADVVVVFMHFGFENESMPSEVQRAEARAAIDAGAALVVGHHPHVVQPVEWYGGGLIAYSMGNFVFDGSDNPTTDSAILFVDLTEAGVASYRLVPVTLDGAGFPYLAP
jgi:poly-gamma-glutamate synthesis protein (capsule biosynthesis protein)